MDHEAAFQHSYPARNGFAIHTGLGRQIAHVQELASARGAKPQKAFECGKVGDVPDQAYISLHIGADVVREPSVTAVVLVVQGWIATLEDPLISIGERGGRKFGMGEGQRSW